MTRNHMDWLRWRHWNAHFLKIIANILKLVLRPLAANSIIEFSNLQIPQNILNSCLNYEKHGFEIFEILSF